MNEYLPERLEYSDKAKKYDEKRVNVGEIENPDAHFRFTGQCGDAMEIFLRIESGVITDAKFQTTGCTAARASGSALMTMIKGKSPEQALEVSMGDILDDLEGLPQVKVHCACLARTTLERAIERYRRRNETA